MELQQRWGKDWDQDAAASFQRDIEDYLTQMINEKHAPLMIPRTTIDPASNRITVLPAAFTNNRWETTATATTTSYTDLLNYTGRGVLTRFVAGEIDSGGAAGLNAGLKITVDGTLIFIDSLNWITVQSSIRSLVGPLNYESTSLVSVHPCPVGIPFNSSIVIQGLISTGTLTAGWNLVKKL